MIASDATKFTEHPLQLESKIGLNFSLAFRPVIEFGISVFKFDFDPIQVFADVPKYDGSLVLVSGVDDNCNPSPASTGQHLSYNGDFSFDIGVGAKIDLTDKIAFAPQHVIASTKVFPASTCFAIGPKATPVAIVSTPAAVVTKESVSALDPTTSAAGVTTAAVPETTAVSNSTVPSSSRFTLKHRKSTATVGPLSTALPSGGLTTTTVVLSRLTTYPVTITQISNSSAYTTTVETTSAIVFTRTMTYCATCAAPTATGSGDGPWLNGTADGSAPPTAAIPRLRRRLGNFRLI